VDGGSVRLAESFFPLPLRERVAQTYERSELVVAG